MFKLLLTSALALTLAASAQQPYPFRDPSLAPQKRIDNLLSLMTLDEKIDCLGTNTAVPRLGVPSFGSSEGIHGVVQRGGWRQKDPITTTQFPQPPGLGETWDPALVQQAAAVEGYDARYISQTPKYNRSLLMLWGPQADLARDPRWGRSEEVYGEDPFFNGTMVTAFIRGLQGDDPHYWLSASLLKHFLANSNENHRDRSSSDFDTRLFWEYYSVPFRMGFEDGGARGVMASYNSWNGTPMAVNPILKSVVIDQWHADVVSSDGGAVHQLWSAHHKFPDQKAAVIACLHAGINQFLDTYKDETHAAIKEGSVTEAELDTLLRRKFEVTLKLGLLDPPAAVAYAKINAENEPEPWNSAHSHDISLRTALESIVLLKNASNTLPLDKSKLKSIAVIGPLADSVHWDWYGGTPPYAITPLAGIKAAVGPDVKINYATSELNQEALTAAKNSDVAIVVVGNDPTCGPDMAHDWLPTVDGGGTLPCTTPSDGREGRDRESLTLEQEQLVKQVFAVQPRTIMVLISSFPYTINWSQQYIPAILHMAHSSQDEGTALARVLFGDANPGGHLVVTWPKSIDQLPPMMDYDIRHGRTYMYFRGEPLYPFGFGLSYTTFRLSNLKPGTTSAAHTGVPDGCSLPGGVANATLNVSVDVTNTGTRAGDEVVQLYLHHLRSSVSRPTEELKGFQRISLAPGETRTVTLPLKVSTLAWWNDKLSRFVVEKEPVELRIGDSSHNILLTTRIQIH